MAGTALVAFLITLWIIHGTGQYGLALFFLLPLLIGAAPTLLITPPKIRLIKMQGCATLAWIMYALLIIVSIKYGLALLVMAAPLMLLLTWTGGFGSYVLNKIAPGQGKMAIFFLLVAIPAVALLEKGFEPSLGMVISATEIKAPASTAWKNALHLQQLPVPEGMIYKFGMDYPRRIETQGSGIRAVRYCYTTRGAFVGPITVWDPPRYLKFEVQEQPTLWPDFRWQFSNEPNARRPIKIRQGQLHFMEANLDNTVLESTTWYYQQLRPAFYWHLWSDYLISSMHDHLAKQIKVNAEHDTQHEL